MKTSQELYEANLQLYKTVRTPKNFHPVLISTLLVFMMLEFDLGNIL